MSRQYSTSSITSGSLPTWRYASQELLQLRLTIYPADLDLVAAVAWDGPHEKRSRMELSSGKWILLVNVRVQREKLSLEGRRSLSYWDEAPPMKAKFI